MRLSGPYLETDASDVASELMDEKDFCDTCARYLAGYATGLEVIRILDLASEEIYQRRKPEKREIHGSD